ncbi:MAG: SDR family oxidoreductase [Treponema sp.]|nr:SDR family oxidoreductase [Treponema sp.]
MNSFKGKVSIITGAASGLGLGIASELSKLGSIVILLDIDNDRLLKAASENMYGPFETKIVDVTNYESIELTFNQIFGKYGHIDYLFNNAGIGGTLPFSEATIKHWNKIINLNMYGVINGMTAIYPIMKKQQSGHIINTSSIGGIIPFSGQALYNTTKYAIAGLSLSLERELKNDNIDISIICPGMVNTRIFYKPIIGNEAPEEYVKIPKEAISVEHAVKDIINGIKRRKKIIITPSILKSFYLRYRLFGKY